MEIYIYIYILDMSTQGNGGFKLMTSASLGVVHNRLSYHLGNENKIGLR
jgi:hypothetical protein